VIQQRNSVRGTVHQLLQDALRAQALPPPRLNADVYETPDGRAFVVEIAVPGLGSGEIEIEATSDMLTVTTRPNADNTRADRRYVQQERSSGPASRVFEFPVDIDPDTIQATLEAGLLKITVPKAEASPRRVIKLKPEG
jgi:HSP20 family protein